MRFPSLQCHTIICGWGHFVLYIGWIIFNLALYVTLKAKHMEFMPYEPKSIIFSFFFGPDFGYLNKTLSCWLTVGSSGCTPVWNYDINSISYLYILYLDIHLKVFFCITLKIIRNRSLIIQINVTFLVLKLKFNIVYGIHFSWSDRLNDKIGGLF